MELSRERPGEVSGLLYPLMVIAAIAVIAFSVVGIASITGWMPSGLMSRVAGVHTIPEVDTARSGVAFECAECGVIETIREIEQRGELGKARADAIAMVAI
jgi:hypothetical protein